MTQIQKMLRQKIRNILLENQEFYQKIVQYLGKGGVENVNNTLQLANTMGYIGNYTYEKQSNLLIPGEMHYWMIDGPHDPAFLQAIGLDQQKVLARKYNSNRLSPQVTVCTDTFADIKGNEGGFLLIWSTN